MDPDILVAAISAAAGVFAALLGVGLGAVLTQRALIHQWSRDKQIDACAAVLRESTRNQIKLRLVSRESGDRGIDWISWNEALALVQLLAGQEIVAAAERIDRVFWEVSGRARRRELVDENDWAAARDEMEAVRLDFLNIARQRILGYGSPLRRLVARPPLANCSSVDLGRLPTGTEARRAEDRGNIAWPLAVDHRLAGHPGRTSFFMLPMASHGLTLILWGGMDVSGELLQEAAAASAEAERVREAAGVLRVAADEVQSLFRAVAEQIDPAIWRGESARAADDQVRQMGDRLHRAAGELNGAAWSMLVRAARLEDSAEQLRTDAALMPDLPLGPGPFGPPPGS